MRYASKAMIPLLVLALAVLLARPAQAAESDVLVRQGEALELDKLTEAAGEYAPGDAGAQVDLNEGLQSILDTGSAALWGVVRKAVRSGILLLTVVLLCALGDGAYSGTGFGTSLEIVPIVGALAITAVAVTDVSSLIGMGRQALDSMDSFSKVLLPTLAAATAASGAVTTATVQQVSTVFFVDLLLRLIRQLLLPLVYLYIGLLTAAACLPENRLGAIAEALKKLVTWILTTALLVFTIYLSIVRIISGSADSATVKLLADVTIRHEDYSGIKLEKGNITLDLNGKTLSKSTRDDNVFYARNAVFWLSPPEATTKDEFLAALQTHARLTVQDSSADRSGKIVQPNGGPAVIGALNTILTVNGGTIENASSVDLDDDSHLKPNCAVLLSGGGKAVINGGTLRGMRGVAVTGYITKEVEGLYKDTFGIEGYNNDTYGNELTVTGGNICATSGEGLIVYEKAKKIELSGGTFTTQSNAYSIWVADTKDGEQTFKGDASSLLASGCRYENNGTECVYSEDGKGVTGNATVALRPANEYAYIDKNGNLATQANCTEITERTDDISTPGWYVVKENLTISLLNISITISN